MTHRLLSAALFGLAMLIAAVAQAGQEPQQLVQSTSEQVMARLKKDHDQLQKKPDLIYPLVEDLVLPHFDFTKMSQWVLGVNWRSASPDQKARFTEQFRTLLVRTYAKALLEYTDQKISYLPFHAAADAKTVTVKTEIIQAGGQNIPVYYNLYHKGDDWKVYDISIDGVSLVNNYRTSFAEEIRQGGLDKLIAHLVEMNSGKVKP
ncbi:MAG TPA: ABC transporter substrate-binding protein [Gammaproteobacteria bacterium]